MLKRALTTIAVITVLSFASSAAWSEPKDIRWGTGPVGSSGHKALVVLANDFEDRNNDFTIYQLLGAQFQRRDRLFPDSD